MASLKDRIAKAKAVTAAAEAEVSGKEFLEEEAARKELAELEARERDARDRKRSADLARRIDVWAEALGDAPVVAISIVSKPHDFVVTAGGTAAYRQWTRGLQDAAMAKMQKGGRQKVDADEVARVYAVAGILDWNGQPVDDRLGVEVSSELGKKLHDFLRDEPAIVTEVLNAVARLDGAASEERKS